MVWRGKNALDRNSRMNSSGNAPCTASDDPVRIAIADISPPTASAVSIPPATITSTPTGPARTVRPNGMQHQR